ncbi:unnamed protein product [Cuscuta campestris]|uniref:cytokinin riboside 5'-monophosphate phosphoribohydrolase n=1 Tax=Cuscuta campestris TaxID=132261 RepID=A0A484MJV4_9ASTE|nr:unnamed protein product [Cuscuta campestris]
MTLEQLLVRLRIHEEGLTHEKKVVVAKANVVEHPPKEGSSKGPKPNKDKKKIGPKGGVAKTKFAGKCYNCGITGHRSSECRKKPQTKKQKKEEALCSELDAMDLCAVVTEVNLVGSNPKEWWVDTGATRHICSNRAMHFDFKETSGDKGELGKKEVILWSYEGRDVDGVGRVSKLVSASLSWFSRDLTLENILPKVRTDKRELRSAMEEGTNQSSVKSFSKDFHLFLREANAWETCMLDNWPSLLYLLAGDVAACHCRQEAFGLRSASLLLARDIKAFGRRGLLPLSGVYSGHVTANLTVHESQYVILSADCSIDEYIIVSSNPRFMAPAVDLGRELVRRKIRLTYGGGNVGLQGAAEGNVGLQQSIPMVVQLEASYQGHSGTTEAFSILPRGINTMEGLCTLISWASEGLHSKPIGLLNIDSYFNNLIKFIDDAVRQNFMALNQRKLFISSFFVDELLDKLEFAKAFPGPGANYDKFTNLGGLDLELHL